MTNSITFKRSFHFRPGRRSQRKIEPGAAPPVTPGRIPRISRLMALAIRFDRLVRDGEIADYADLARLGYVSRARVTQIMNLLNLAPDIQEAILYLPRVKSGRDPVIERDVRPITVVADWRKQRILWSQIAP